jgi:hypothetical protein
MEKGGKRSGLWGYVTASWLVVSCEKRAVQCRQQRVSPCEREVSASGQAGALGVRDCFRVSTNRLAVARRVATVGRYSAENLEGSWTLRYLLGGPFGEAGLRERLFPRK